MARFAAGLLLGAVSGGATWLGTGDHRLTLIAAAVSALATWCGIALFVDFFDL